MNENCFLDRPAWTAVFLSATCPDEIFTDRSKLGISLLTLVAQLPRLAKRTRHAVLMQHTLSPGDFNTIATDARVVRSKASAWRRRFDITLIHTEKRPKSDTVDFDKRYELLGVSLVVKILVNRVLSAIVPFERAILEEDVQNAAIELKEVFESTKHSARAKFFLQQKVGAANAAIDTHADFLEVVNSGKVVEVWRFKRFWEMMGGVFCDGATCCE